MMVSDGDVPLAASHLGERVCDHGIGLDTLSPPLEVEQEPVP
jgi:hypothetical protein